MEERSDAVEAPAKRAQEDEREAIAVATEEVPFEIPRD